MVKHLSHEFFARSPQNLVYGPDFGENVQKTRVTGVLPLDPVRNGAYFHEIALSKLLTAPVTSPHF